MADSHRSSKRAKRVYGFDPELPVLDGDWRLNPGTGLGVAFHPSQPTPNEWADFGDVERPIFDFAINETFEPTQDMRADVTAGSMSELHLGRSPSLIPGEGADPEDDLGLSPSLVGLPRSALGSLAASVVLPSAGIVGAAPRRDFTSSAATGTAAAGAAAYPAPGPALLAAVAARAAAMPVPPPARTAPSDRPISGTAGMSSAIAKAMQAFESSHTGLDASSSRRARGDAITAMDAVRSLVPQSLVVPPTLPPGHGAAAAPASLFSSPGAQRAAAPSGSMPPPRFFDAGRAVSAGSAGGETEAGASFGRSDRDVSMASSGPGGGMRRDDRFAVPGGGGGGGADDDDGGGGGMGPGGGRGGGGGATFLRGRIESSMTDGSGLLMGGRDISLDSDDGWVGRAGAGGGGGGGDRRGFAGGGPGGSLLPRGASMLPPASRLSGADVDGGRGGPPAMAVRSTSAYSLSSDAGPALGLALPGALLPATSPLGGASGGAAIPRAPGSTVAATTTTTSSSSSSSSSSAAAASLADPTLGGPGGLRLGPSSLTARLFGGASPPSPSGSTTEDTMGGSATPFAGAPARGSAADLLAGTRRGGRGQGGSGPGGPPGRTMAAPPSMEHLPVDTDEDRDAMTRLQAIAAGSRRYFGPHPAYPDHGAYPGAPREGAASKRLRSVSSEYHRFSVGGETARSTSRNPTTAVPGMPSGDAAGRAALGWDPTAERSRVEALQVQEAATSGGFASSSSSGLPAAVLRGLSQAPALTVEEAEALSRQYRGPGAEGSADHPSSSSSSSAAPGFPGGPPPSRAAPSTGSRLSKDEAMKLRKRLRKRDARRMAAASTRSMEREGARLEAELDLLTSVEWGSWVHSTALSALDGDRAVGGIAPSDAAASSSSSSSSRAGRRGSAMDADETAYGTARPHRIEPLSDPAEATSLLALHGSIRPMAKLAARVGRPPAGRGVLLVSPPSIAGTLLPALGAAVVPGSMAGVAGWLHVDPKLRVIEGGDGDGDDETAGDGGRAGSTETSSRGGSRRRGAAKKTSAAAAAAAAAEDEDEEEVMSRHAARREDALAGPMLTAQQRIETASRQSPAERSSVARRSARLLAASMRGVQSELQEACFLVCAAGVKPPAEPGVREEITSDRQALIAEMADCLRLSPHQREHISAHGSAVRAQRAALRGVSALREAHQASLLRAAPASARADAAVDASLEPAQRERLLAWSRRLLVSAEHPDIPDAPYAALNLALRRSANPAEADARLGPWTPLPVLEQIGNRRGLAGQHAREVMESRMQSRLDAVMLAEHPAWLPAPAPAPRAGAAADEAGADGVEAAVAAAASKAASATAQRLAMMAAAAAGRGSPGQPGGFAIHGDAYAGPSPYASATRYPDA